jgi:hypothetical protein
MSSDVRRVSVVNLSTVILQFLWIQALAVGWHDTLASRIKLFLPHIFSCLEIPRTPKDYFYRLEYIIGKAVLLLSLAMYRMHLRESELSSYLILILYNKRVLGADNLQAPTNL